MDRFAAGAGAAMVAVKKGVVRALLFVLDSLPEHYVLQFADMINAHYRRDRTAKPSLLIDRMIGLTLRNASNVAVAINELAEAVPVESIVTEINSLVTSRHHALHALFQSAPDITHPELKALVELWRAENNGAVLDAATLAQYVDAFRSYSGRGRRRVELLLLHAMIKAENLDLVMKLLSSSQYYSLRDLPPAYVVGILRCVLKTDPSRYRTIRDEMGKGLSELDRLKVLEVDQDAGYIAKSPPHNEIVRQFLKAAPKTVAADFEAYVKPFYDSQDMSLMDARTDAKTRDAILGDIRGRLVNKSPLSFIRVGDGEAYACAYDSDLHKPDDAVMREHHWWGVELTPDKRALLQKQIRLAIENADYIGMPSVYRFIRDTHFSTKDLKSSASARGLITCMSSIRPKSGAKIVEDRIHQVVFRMEQLAPLCRLPGVRVHTISSLKPDIVATLFPQAAAITVPTHHKMLTNDTFAAGAEPLPYVYEKITEQIRETVEAGDLVLVGAGIIGKIFVDEAARRGAVALDIGSMVDYMAGAKTRSVADLV
ncbi:MAG: hypothetical protein ACRCS9_08155 [Hyphomicrobium sp.]